MDAATRALEFVARARMVKSLSGHQVATIRAALRLWVETEGPCIPDCCYEEARGAGVVSDDEIESLIAELAFADAVTLSGPSSLIVTLRTPGIRPEAPIDPRD